MFFEDNEDEYYTSSYCENCGTCRDLVDTTYMLYPYDTICLCLECCDVPHEKIKRRGKKTFVFQSCAEM